MTETYVDGPHSRFDPAWTGWRRIDYCTIGTSRDWAEFGVLRGPDGALYVLANEGCSCSDYWDKYPSDAIKVPTWHHAVSRALDWARKRDLDITDFISRLSQVRPPAHL